VSRILSILAAFVLFTPLLAVAQTVPYCPNLYLCVGTSTDQPSAVVNTYGDLALGIGSGAGDYSLDAYDASSWAIAIGSFAQAFGMQSIATGSNALADSNDAIAIGTQAHAGNGDYGYDIVDGYVIPHPGEQVAVGSSATATGAAATATGTGATATGDVSTAVGATAQGTGYATSAFGNNAQATGDYSTSVGAGSYAPGFMSTALGQAAGAPGSFSVAIGADSVADQADTVSVGNSSYHRRVVNVANGIDGHDATTVEQIAPLAAYLGGSASFMDGVWVPPTYVLKNPYAPGTFHNVGDALSAIDTALSAINPVRYDDGSLSSVTLGGQPSGVSNDNPDQNASETTGSPESSGEPVIVHNMAPGVDGTDGANVDQVEEAITTANSYTDLRATQTLNQANSYTDLKAAETLNSANAYTDWRVGQLSADIKRAVASSVAQAQMVATFAGADQTARNRVAVGTGWQGGYGAIAVGYQHVTATRHRVTWNVGASISGGSGSVGAGVGFSW
jgi:autotransporter adhesin